MPLHHDTDDGSAPVPAADGEWSAIHDGLAAIVGRAHVLTDADMVAGFVTDWTGHWHGRTTAVVRPADTGEVSAVLALCHRAGIAVVPQGGNTGLVGGSIPMNGEVVLSTTRLDRIEEVDPVGRTLAAGAGVRVAAAQRAAAEHGLALGTDLASRESATLGGIVSTNAGGVAMVKNGSTRSRLLGVEAVLADGRVVTRWTPLTKDNIGYDLPGLLAGAEGTLAVITRVLLRLVLPARTTATVLAGVDTISAALTLRDAISAAGLTLEAGELMTADGLDLVCAQQGVRRPLGTRTAYTALFEVSGPADPATALVEVLSDADSGGSVVDTGGQTRCRGATADDAELPRRTLRLAARRLSHGSADLLRALRGWQRARESARRAGRPTRRGDRRGAADGGPSRRQHQRRARHRTREAGVDRTRPRRRGPSDHGRGPHRLRPGLDPQSARAALRLTHPPTLVPVRRKPATP